MVVGGKGAMLAIHRGIQKKVKTESKVDFETLTSSPLSGRAGLRGHVGGHQLLLPVGGQTPPGPLPQGLHRQGRAQDTPRAAVFSGGIISASTESNRML